MTTALSCLVFFAAWTLGLVALGIVPYRVGQVLLAGRAANSFSPAEPEGPGWYQRLLRAHANCVENLPVFASVVLTAAVSGAASSTLDTLAVVYVAARVGQSVAHVASGRSLVINVRFTFFLIQVCAVLSMAWLVAQHLLARG